MVLEEKGTEVFGGKGIVGFVGLDRPVVVLSNVGVESGNCVVTFEGMCACVDFFGCYCSYFGVGFVRLSLLRVGSA